MRRAANAPTFLLVDMHEEFSSTPSIPLHIQVSVNRDQIPDLLSLAIRYSDCQQLLSVWRTVEGGECV